MMYTQCTHCKAVFRVNMREITVAKGNLRCGECHSIFSTDSNLSTKPFQAYEDNPRKKEKKRKKEEQNKAPVKGRPFTDTLYSGSPTIGGIEEAPPSKVGLYGAILLSILLAAQILYNNKHYITGEPRHQPEKVKMLKHNVFTHPNEKDILLISASIENTAKKPQPYPILEVKLTNSQSQVIALRRFTPKEYLKGYTSDMLLPVKQATDLKLRIKDPGKNATRFQFNFY